jgi:hypothetical protein
MRRPQPSPLQPGQAAPLIARKSGGSQAPAAAPGAPDSQASSRHDGPAGTQPALGGAGAYQAPEGPAVEGLGAPAGPGGPAWVQGGQSGTSATGPDVAEGAEDAEAQAEAQWTVAVLELEAARLQAAAAVAQEEWEEEATSGGSGGGNGARVGEYPFYEYVSFRPYADDD